MDFCDKANNTLNILESNKEELLKLLEENDKNEKDVKDLMLEHKLKSESKGYRDYVIKSISANITEVNKILKDLEELEEKIRNSKKVLHEELIELNNLYTKVISK